METTTNANPTRDTMSDDMKTRFIGLLNEMEKYPKLEAMMTNHTLDRLATYGEAGRGHAGSNISLITAISKAMHRMTEQELTVIQDLVDANMANVLKHKHTLLGFEIPDSDDEDEATIDQVKIALLEKKYINTILKSPVKAAALECLLEGLAKYEDMNMGEVFMKTDHLLDALISSKKTKKEYDPLDPDYEFWSDRKN